MSVPDLEGLSLLQLWRSQFSPQCGQQDGGYHWDSPHRLQTRLIARCGERDTMEVSADHR